MKISSWRKSAYYIMCDSFCVKYNFGPAELGELLRTASTWLWGMSAHWHPASTNWLSECLVFPRCSQIICYAVACTETARIAQLVARQRTSKRKTGRQINCQMRVKKTMPFFLEGRTFHIKVCPRAYGNATSVPDNY